MTDRICPDLQELDALFAGKDKRWIVDTCLMSDGTASTTFAALDALKDAYNYLDYHRQGWGILQRLRRAIKWMLADHGSTWSAWAPTVGLFWERQDKMVQKPWRLHAPSSTAPEPTDAYIRRWLLELPIEVLVYMCSTLANQGYCLL